MSRPLPPVGPDGPGPDGPGPDRPGFRTAGSGGRRPPAALLAIALILLALVLGIGAYVVAGSYFGDGEGPAPAPETSTSPASDPAPSPVTPIEEPSEGTGSSGGESTSPTRIPLTEGPSDQVVHPTEEESPS